MKANKKHKRMTTNKTTHTIHDVDALILEKVILLKTAKGDEKKKLAKEIRRLEKHFNDCNDKHINGKKYPERMKSLYDPTPQTEKQKKELLKLIDSVGEFEDDSPERLPDNLSGIFPPFIKI